MARCFVEGLPAGRSEGVEVKNENRQKLHKAPESSNVPLSVLFIRNANHSVFILAFFLYMPMQLPTSLQLSPSHKTHPSIFTLAFPANVHLWVFLEGKMEGRLRT